VAAPAPSWLNACASGVRLSLKVTPRAAQPGVVGVEADAGGRAWLAVRVTAPPEGGKANAEVIKLLARRWGVRARDLKVVSGAGARRKVLQLAGPPGDLISRLIAIEAPEVRG
jgi:uncharacterized protein (TIGR00251 family)